MGWKIVCRDLRFDCECVIHSATDQKLLDIFAEHLKKNHGYSMTQLHDRKTLKAVYKAITHKEKNQYVQNSL
jgi:predicted small metal-binding protein